MRVVGVLRVRWSWLAALAYLASFDAAALVSKNPRAQVQHTQIEQSQINQARELMERVDQFNREGKYRDAIPLAERAVSIREQVLGPEHPDTAASLNLLGRFYRLSGDFSNAELAIRRALAIREKTLGDEHSDTVNSMIALGIYYLDTGAYPQAEEMYRRALSIREKIAGAEHPDTALVLNNLANLYYAMGAYAKAEPLYRRALAIREKSLGPEHQFTLDSVNNLALDLFIMGNYAQAEPLYQRTLTTREKNLGPEHPSTAHSINLLALYYKRTGVYYEAEKLFRRALAINEKVFGPEAPVTADSVESLATLYAETGAYAAAEPLYRRALAINEKRLGVEHPDTARSLHNLGEVYELMGAYAQAEPMLVRALAIKEKSLGPDHPYTALTLSVLATTYSAMGDLKRAEPLHLRSLAIVEKALGPEHPETAETLRICGTFYSMAQDRANAERYLRRALAIEEKVLGPEHPSTAETIQQLALVQWAEGDSAQALSLLKRAQTIHAKNSERFLLAGSEARKQAYLRSFAERTYENVSFSINATDPVGVELGLTSVLQYKVRTLDFMSESASRLRQSVHDQDRRVLEQLGQVANQLSTLTYQGLGNLSPQLYRERLEELARQQDSLEAELASRSDEFRLQRAPIALADIRSAIPGDTILLEWFRYVPFVPGSPPSPAGKETQSAGRYAAYLLTQDAPPAVVDVGDADQIDAAVREFRASLANPDRVDTKALSAALSAKLLRPLRAHLKRFRKLLISPDGALNLIPFAALLDSQGDYLARSFEITYLSTARDLSRLASKSHARGHAVVMADPNFGVSAKLAKTEVLQGSAAFSMRRSADFDQSGLIFLPLINTAQEAQDLKKLLKLTDGSVLLRDAATEGKLKELHGPRILHIASHGFFLSNQTAADQHVAAPIAVEAATFFENPLLRSGLALAGANARHSGENDDGILTALEAAQLDLNGTELVVLSACDTGVGEVQNGEGVYGLRRSLVLAGAQTQVTSLWKVSDAATRQLMQDFYRRLLKGEGRSTALHKAQRSMRAKRESSHPFYWASFVATGNWTALPAERSDR